jgi:hypothetical protein
MHSQRDLRFVRRARAVIVYAAALAAVVPATASTQAGASEEIGTVVAAKQVTGLLPGEERELAKGDPLFQDETLVTGAKGSGEFRLNDDTRLALGPGARLTLDELVYEPAESTPTVVLNLVEGAFRFMTGKLDPTAYKIKAGGASLAVRGTIFDVYVDEEEGVAVLLHEGAVAVCGAGGFCQQHKAVGRVIRVTRSGILSTPLEWSDTLMPGFTLKRAFPFLTRRLAIDPVRRLKVVAILKSPAIRSGSSIAKKATGTLRRATRSVRKIFKSPF